VVSMALICVLIGGFIARFTIKMAPANKQKTTTDTGAR
jgi:hypothetical protein